eukprot:1652658-Rhodomonas_salina.1
MCIRDRLSAAATWYHHTLPQYRTCPSMRVAPYPASVSVYRKYARISIPHVSTAHDLASAYHHSPRPTGHPVVCA